MSLGVEVEVRGRAIMIDNDRREGRRVEIQGRRGPCVRKFASVLVTSQCLYEFMTALVTSQCRSDADLALQLYVDCTFPGKNQYYFVNIALCSTARSQHNI